MRILKSSEALPFRYSRRVCGSYPHRSVSPERTASGGKISLVSTVKLPTASYLLPISRDSLFDGSSGEICLICTEFSAVCRVKYVRAYVHRIDTSPPAGAGEAVSKDASIAVVAEDV